MPRLSSNPFTILLLTVFLPPTLLLATRLLKIIPRYQQARKLDLPIYVTLFSWQYPLWQFLHSYFLFLRHLPFPPFNGLAYSYFGWTDIDKGLTHQRVGNAFIVVSPYRLGIFCAEPSVCLEIASKYRTWTKSRELYEIFNTFGPNVNSVNGNDWRRHRKISSQAIREENYALVWREARKQATQLLAAIETRPDNITSKANLVTLREDFALLAMHVLSSAVLGHSYDYGTGLQQVEPGHQLSYFASLTFILQNIMSLILFKSLVFPDWLLPQFLRKLKLSVREYEQYLREAAEQEYKSQSRKREGASLVTALVQANEDAKSEQPTAGGRAMHLSDSELFGNMYIFNLAGFETTSFALSFTFPRLAVDPSLQDWVQEEIDVVFKSEKNAGKELDYENAFQQLPRCRALLLETLRLHAAATATPRLSPPDEETELWFPSLNRAVVVPRDTYVTINVSFAPFLHSI